MNEGKKISGCIKERVWSFVILILKNCKEVNKYKCEEDVKNFIYFYLFCIVDIVRNWLMIV